MNSYNSARRSMFNPQIFLAISIVGLPFAVLAAGVLSIASRSVTIPYWGIILVLSITIIKGNFRKCIQILSTNLGKIYLLFWGIYLLRIVYDCTTIGDILEYTMSEYILRAIGMCLIPSIAVFTYLSKQNSTSSSLGYVFLRTLGILLFCILLFNREYLNIHNLRTEAANEISVANMSPLVLGYLSSLGIILSIFYIIHQVKTLKRFVPANILIITLILSLSVYSLIFGASRGSVLSALLGVFVLAVSLIKRARIWESVLLLLGFSVIMAFQKIVTGSGILQTRIIGTLDAIQMGGNKASRFELWDNGWNQFLDSPLFGSSFVDLNTGTYPHNIIIEAYMATGFIGGTIFVMLCIIGVHRAYILVSRKSDYGWVALLYINYLVAGCFSFALYEIYPFWYSLAAVLGVRIKKRKQGNIPN
jgi:O-antigen ligase